MAVGHDHGPRRRAGGVARVSLLKYRALFGGAGDDTLIISSSSFRRMDGGLGTDLDLSAITGTDAARGRVTGIEKIDLLPDTTANVLTLDKSDVIDLTDSAAGNTLIVSGAANDELHLSSGFARATGDGATVMVDGGWWMVDGGWWMVDGGWWMVDGGW